VSFIIKTERSFKPAQISALHIRERKILAARIIAMNSKPQKKQLDEIAPNLLDDGRVGLEPAIYDYWRDSISREQNLRAEEISLCCS
jgi:hypothetical protein